jgi:nucleotide-binding universal stress UspA family protein
MKTLLVPVDFSPVADNAMRYAIDMAMAIDAGIILVNVYQVPVAYTDVPVSMLSIDEIRQSSEEKLRKLEEDLRHMTAGRLSIRTVSKMGNTVDVLEELCESTEPFAVIMGSHGTTGIERLIMGSTTLSAMRHIKYPIIVIPPGTTYKTINKIGLACDFRDVEDSVPVEFIKRIVHEFGAELHVLNVESKNQHDHDKRVQEATVLKRMLGDITPTYHFLQQENVVEGVNQFADSNNLDVVMVIPRKHKLLDALFSKSKSKELVTHAHIPIVSIHE